MYLLLKQTKYGTCLFIIFEIVNKCLLAVEKYMLKMQLRQVADVNITYGHLQEPKTLQKLVMVDAYTEMH